MWISRTFLSLCLLGLLFTACTKQQTSAPQAVNWHGDSCERCRMVLSHPNFAAQIRYAPSDQQTARVVVFDDIGCAILWLEGKPWKESPSTEIWVVDAKSGDWLDAREATYVPGYVTPMAYGLGAQAEPVVGGLNFYQARQHVLAVEQRFSQRGQQLIQKFQAQAKQRETQGESRTVEQKLPAIVPER